MATGKLESLSEQQLVDCDHEVWSFGLKILHLGLIAAIKREENLFKKILDCLRSLI